MEHSHYLVINTLLGGSCCFLLHRCLCISLFLLPVCLLVSLIDSFALHWQNNHTSQSVRRRALAHRSLELRSLGTDAICGSSAASTDIIQSVNPTMQVHRTEKLGDFGLGTRSACGQWFRRREAQETSGEVSPLAGLTSSFTYI